VLVRPSQRWSNSAAQNAWQLFCNNNCYGFAYDFSKSGEDSLPISEINQVGKAETDETVIIEAFTEVVDGIWLLPGG
jgi:hypothetical protein